MRVKLLRRLSVQYRAKSLRRSRLSICIYPETESLPTSPPTAGTQDSEAISDVKPADDAAASTSSSIPDDLVETPCAIGGQADLALEHTPDVTKEHSYRLSRSIFYCHPLFSCRYGYAPRISPSDFLKDPELGPFPPTLHADGWRSTQFDRPSVISLLVVQFASGWQPSNHEARPQTNNSGPVEEGSNSSNSTISVHPWTLVRSHSRALCRESPARCKRCTAFHAYY